MKKLQIFVSSTYNDLIVERQKVVEGILNAGHIPAGMELFGGPASVIKTIQRWINQSDMCILLLGGKYGSIYKAEGISFTEWEYRYAKSQNKPVCIIVLSESLLHKKAAVEGESKIFEKTYKKKYKQFRDYLQNDGLWKEVNSVNEIQGAVQSHILQTLENPDYDLIGWVRGDAIINDWKKQSNEVLVATYKQVLDSYISRLYGNFDTSELSKSLSEKFISKLNYDGILNSFHRIVQFCRANDGLIKVVIEDEIEYAYLVPEHRAFGKLFQATKQQAMTYKVEKVLINNEDYTSSFHIEQRENVNRGQLRYYVESVNSISMGDEFPVNIFYQSSYECPPLAFFQSYGLSYPCKNFEVEMFLRDDLADEYSILTSTNAMFSKVYADSFKANEVKNFGVCRIRLQEWALPSDGYTATLKKKTEENH